MSEKISLDSSVLISKKHPSNINHIDKSPRQHNTRQ